MDVRELNPDGRDRFDGKPLGLGRIILADGLHG
jgi:hypothetical protein